MRGAFLAAVAVLVSFSARTADAFILDPKFTQTQFAKLETMLTGMAWAPDGSDRLFLIRHTGEVRIVENGVVLATPFATLAPIYKTDECGLLGVAFDPAFSENGYIYFYVSVSDAQQQIVRYTAKGNLGADKTVLVGDIPASGPNHCGGGLGFGPDGKLYWSTGDFGKSMGADDDTSTMAGKINRGNPDGTAPLDNPFFDGAGPNNDYIWARGFRNPFSLTREPSSERLWVNVVGTLYEQVFTPLAGDNAGWDNFENNQPAGYITPIIAYRTGNFDNRTITSATRAGGVASFTTNIEHRFRVGTKVTIAGVANASFNGTGFVSAIPSTTEFSLKQAGASASSTGGTATTLNIGNAITGGTFWDSSAVPTEYRGNFFFGDYISSKLVRAKLDAPGSVTEVDIWGDYLAPIDFDIGPDGNLYYISYGSAATGGTVARTSYQFTSQALVVSRLHVRAPEGGTAAFHVRLAMAPTGAISVSVANSAGDADVSVSVGAALTFDASNWSKPQLVKLSAADDPDSTDDEATLTVSSASLTSENVVARVTDDDGLSLLVSPTSVSFVEGETSTFQVSLSGPPGEAVEVDVARTGGDDDIEVSTGEHLVFDASSWSVPQIVTLAAADDPDAIDDAATITLSAARLAPAFVSASVTDNDTTSLDGGVAGAGGTSGSDGGSKSDAGGASGSESDRNDGCGCRLQNRREAESSWLLVGLLGLLVRRFRTAGSR